MTYEEFISKYNDRWSGTVDDYKKLGIGNADENGIDWLLKYQDAEDEGDVDKMSKLFPLAPLTLRPHAKFQKHANGFFDQFIKPNYADPKKQNQAYTAFINNTGFSDSATADAAIAARAKSGNPVLPMSDSEVKVAAAKKAAQAKPVGPADVKAAAAMPQKSIAEEQADYIRSRGGRTAADVSAQDAYNGQMNYKEMTGFDISTAEGRRQSENAALLRGGHAKAMTYYDKGGQYDKARDAAVKKHFSGQDYVGNNPLTGAFMDARTGEEWGSEQAFRFNQKTNLTNPTAEDIEDNTRKYYDVTTTPPPESPEVKALKARFKAAGEEDVRNSQYRAADNASLAASIAEQAADPAFQASKFAASTRPEDVALRARVRSSSLNDDSLNNVSAAQYASPSFLHWTKGNAVNDLGVDPSAGHAPDTYNNVTLPSNGFGVRGHLPLNIPNMKLPPMPQGSAEDAADERLGLQAFRNAMGPAARPENQVAQSGGRPLGPMNLNRPSIKPIVPFRAYPKFR